MRKLKQWNGRFTRNGENANSSVAYVAAYSVNDAIKMMDKFSRFKMTKYEIKGYWNPGCWDNAMDGVVVERGVWIATEYGSYQKPQRVV